MHIVPDRDRDFTPATDSDLDALSQYSDQDIDEAESQWDADGGADSKGLLDAEPERDKE